MFSKKLKKLKGRDFLNLKNKINEIRTISDLNHYKNLRNPLNNFKRVHINNSSVILFFGGDGKVYLVDLEHHDIIYKADKKTLIKYNNLEYN